MNIVNLILLLMPYTIHPHICGDIGVLWMRMRYHSLAIVVGAADMGIVVGAFITDFLC